MIDTDKYEGHTPAPWKAAYDFPHHGQIQTGLVGPNGKDLGYENNDDGQIANAQLIADAPLLLEEVKRLRERNEKLHSRCMHLENLLEEWQGAYE